MAEKELRDKIRTILNEDKQPSNFLKAEEATETKQLSDQSESKVIGDPLTDVKMNQLANDQGSDGKNAPTVSVTAGSENNSNDEHAGQKQAVFHNKTTMAESALQKSYKLSLLVREVLKESFENK